MPEKETVERSRELKREDKAPTTQAGPFVEEEIEHVREGKHGARSTKQAIAIGLSKARRAGVKLGPEPKGRSRSRGRGGRSAVSSSALARQARSAARRRTPAERSASARKAARTRARRKG